MNQEQLDTLRSDAENAKANLKVGQISLAEAKKRAQPFIDAVNIRAVELAKEYKMHPKLMNVSSFLRAEFR